jgi:ubiquitin-activating enzyme E1
LREEDVGIQRAEVTKPRLKELNENCELTVLRELNDEIILQHSIVIMTNNKSLTELKRISDLCHENGITFICADTFGLWGFGFVDFGKKHVVTDKNGEPPIEGYILGLIKDEKGQGFISTQTKHDLEDGDIILIEEVQGIEGINGQTFKVEVKGQFQLAIGDIGKYKGSYIKGGMYIQQKVPKEYSYDALSTLFSSPIAFNKVVSLDEVYEREYSQNVILAQALLTFRERHNGELPRSYHDEDTDQVMQIASEINKQTEKTDLNESVMRRIIRQSRGDLNCMASLFGGKKILYIFLI